jgi:uncharacterized protein YabE (DUF348 family)
MSSLTTPVQQRQRLRIQWLESQALQTALQLGALALLLWAGWALTARTVTVSVNGVGEEVITHRRTLAPLLVDLGLNLSPEDLVSPGLDTPLRANMDITIRRARQARIFVDGREVLTHSWATTPRELLAYADLGVDHYDRIVVDGYPLGLDDLLPVRRQVLTPPTYDQGYIWENLRSQPLDVRIYRAIPITVDDGHLPYTIRTTAQSVGEALREAQITLYLGDRVQPSLGSPVSTGLRVTIQRSTPISLQVDGRLVKTRTQGRTVGDALTEMGIGVAGLDEVSPPMRTELFDDIEIAVTRIREEILISEDIVPFNTIYIPDRNLLIDTQQMVNSGAEGITRSRYRVRYENGEETGRALEDTWVAQQPADRQIAYGQRIEPRTFTTASGETITYWRQIRMRASSYSAGTAGVPRSAPWYGRTRTGDVMRFGIVAVDPTVIPLRSRVYVPGYGVGDALDTGSAVRSRMIDLGYDDDNLVLWRRWVDVYLLWPPPPEYQITWVVPNWPIER